MYLYFAIDNLKWNLIHFCSTIAINRRNITINFCMHYCNWQLLCTTAIDNMNYCSCWLLYLLVRLPIIAPTTFECIIENDKFHMDHCNGHLLFTLLLRTFSVGTIAYDNIKLHNWIVQLKTFFALLQRTTFVCNLVKYTPLQMTTEV